MTWSGWFLAGVLVTLILVLLTVFLVRIRALAGRVGSFECACQRPSAASFTSGIASFGDHELSWYRLISLSPWPSSTWKREDLEVGEAKRRASGRSIMEVHCSYQG